LCPRLHANPRGAQVCTQCGSRDLSEPQPPTSLTSRWWRVGLGLWLEVCSLVVLAAFVQTIAANRPLQLQLVIVLLFLALCWAAYLQLPAWVRRAVGWVWRRVKNHGRTH